MSVSPSAAAAAPVPGGARPGGSPADLAAVWGVITGMYRAFTTGERARVDAFLDPDATIFDSATAALVCGRSDLERVRDARPAAPAGSGGAVLSAYGEVIDVFGDLAVARYWLRAGVPGLAPELVRNTAVLRRGPGGWLIAHLHEDVQAAS